MRRASLAAHMQHDVAPMRPRAMLPPVDVLPRAERPATTGIGSVTAVSAA